MRWLIVGSAGMLGTDLLEILDRPGHTVVGVDLPVIDITSPTSIEATLDEHRPDVVINAAAYTAVDRAETDEAIALRVNGDGPANLARAIADRDDIRLVHLSTDYVFPGDATEPYAEDAPTGPRSAYGRTKLVGEQAVRLHLPDRGIVVRTAWLYGEHGPNFVSTMLRLEREKDTLDVVDDQRGQPTWTRDLADFIARLLNADPPAGIYHGTSSGDTTWFGLAREVFRLVGADPGRVHPTTTDRFPRPARRPAYSVLAHGASADLVAPISSWDDALGRYLPRIRSLE